MDNAAADAGGLTQGLNGAIGSASSSAAGASGSLGASALSGVAGAAGAQSSSFSTMLENAVQDVNAKMQTAEVEKGKALTGETSNVHQAMIAVQESSVAFSLMVEVRNKLVESYQELMRMQI